MLIAKLLIYVTVGMVRMGPLVCLSPFTVKLEDKGHIVPVLTSCEGEGGENAIFPTLLELG